MIYLPFQVTCYEDDYKREKQEKMVLEDKMKKADNEIKNLKTIVDILVRGVAF